MLSRVGQLANHLRRFPTTLPRRELWIMPNVNPQPPDAGSVSGFPDSARGVVEPRLSWQPSARTSAARSQVSRLAPGQRTDQAELVAAVALATVRPAAGTAILARLPEPDRKRVQLRMLSKDFPSQHSRRRHHCVALLAGGIRLAKRQRIPVRSRWIGPLRDRIERDADSFAEALRSESSAVVGILLSELPEDAARRLLRAMPPGQQTESLQTLRSMRRVDRRVVHQTLQELARKVDAREDQEDPLQDAGYGVACRIVAGLSPDDEGRLMRIIAKQDRQLLERLDASLIQFGDLLGLPESLLRQVVACTDRDVWAIALQRTSTRLLERIRSVLDEQGREALADAMRYHHASTDQERRSAQQQVVAVARKISPPG
ncbi:hypothetical protein FYK55_12940 [Roseiconus nitratireducens]|uniref:Uncharacterized protein n=1 Tax=Roseiconus nitratireducens TaxID=2605748 RepID=A0A5M6D9S6_9BACT|nr:FliG C-terminal domain-containing protein [Roseiconus nitratireducens]KAA5543180.1 hypothetical protein FYK55_12940 [Roseiconus nitratireducens]